MNEFASLALATRVVIHFIFALGYCHGPKWLSFRKERYNRTVSWSIITFIHNIVTIQNKTMLITSEWFEILYTFTTTVETGFFWHHEKLSKTQCQKNPVCYKNILKISGPTPSRKPNYGISKFSIFIWWNRILSDTGSNLDFITFIIAVYTVQC